MGKRRQRVLVDISSGRAVDDEEVFRAAIDCANGAELVLIGRKGPSHATPEDRTETVRLLALVAGGKRDVVAEECFPLFSRLFSGLGVKRTCTIVLERGFVMGYSQDFLSCRSLLDYAIALTLDAKLPYGKTLSQCRLPSCGMFYEARKNPLGGPLNKTYCSRKHRIDHHNSSERKARNKPPVRHK